MTYFQVKMKIRYNVYTIFSVKLILSSFTESLYFTAIQDKFFVPISKFLYILLNLLKPRRIWINSLVYSRSSPQRNHKIGILRCPSKVTEAGEYNNCRVFWFCFCVVIVKVKKNHWLLKVLKLCITLFPLTITILKTFTLTDGTLTKFKQTKHIHVCT